MVLLAVTAARAKNNAALEIGINDRIAMREWEAERADSRPNSDKPMANVGSYVRDAYAVEPAGFAKMARSLAARERIDNSPGAFAWAIHGCHPF
jgi:hypothetical protein